MWIDGEREDEVTPDDVLAFYRARAEYLLANQWEFNGVVASVTYCVSKPLHPLWMDSLEVSLELKPGVSVSAEHLDVLLYGFLNYDFDCDDPVKECCISGSLTEILSESGCPPPLAPSRPSSP